MDFSRLILVGFPERFSMLQVKEGTKTEIVSSSCRSILRGDRAGRYSHDGGFPEPGIWTIAVGEC